MNSRRGLLTAVAIASVAVAAGLLAWMWMKHPAVPTPPAAYVGTEACASCHASIDSLGFAFENFDGIGKLRTTDNGKAVDSSVTIKLITDSPIMQGVLMMMSNPMFANADGGKLERIKGQKAVFKNKDGSGSVNVVVNGTLLVQIEGSQVSDADLRKFAEAVDYAKIGSML